MTQSQRVLKIVSKSWTLTVKFREKMSKMSEWIFHVHRRLQSQTADILLAEVTRFVASSGIKCLEAREWKQIAQRQTITRSCVVIDYRRAVKKHFKNPRMLCWNHLVGNVFPASRLANGYWGGMYWSFARLFCCYFLQLIMITSLPAYCILAFPASSFLQADTGVDIGQTAVDSP